MKNVKRPSESTITYSFKYSLNERQASRESGMFVMKGCRIRSYRGLPVVVTPRCASEALQRAQVVRWHVAWIINTDNGLNIRAHSKCNALWRQEIPQELTPVFCCPLDDISPPVLKSSLPSLHSPIIIEY